MRFWNIHDDELGAVLRSTIVDHPVSFETGSEGGVAIYYDNRFVGVWIECVRGLHSYVPAGYLEPTYADLSMEDAVTATKLILERQRRGRSRLRLIS